MKDLFTSEQVNVQQGLDLVQLQLGSSKIRMYYQTVFKICSSMQGASKLAMATEGVRPEKWGELAKYDSRDVDTPCHHEYRRSFKTTNLTHWKVAFEGPLVVMTFDELTAKFHYADAAKLCVWLRRAAKQAKNWSGDRSRIWNTYARLTNAAENDKTVFVN